MGTIRSYRDLLVWQKGVDLVVDVYHAMKALPRGEQFGLTAQIRRAAGSVPANVAEGHTRAHSKEYRNFISVAQGSLAELETHLIIAQRLGYLAAEAVKPLLGKAAQLGRMMSGLDRSLASRS